MLVDSCCGPARPQPVCDCLPLPRLPAHLPPPSLLHQTHQLSTLVGCPPQELAACVRAPLLHGRHVGIHVDRQHLGARAQQHGQLPAVRPLGASWCEIALETSLEIALLAHVRLRLQHVDLHRQRRAALLRLASCDPTVCHREPLVLPRSGESHLPPHLGLLVLHVHLPRDLDGHRALLARPHVPLVVLAGRPLEHYIPARGQSRVPLRPGPCRRTLHHGACREARRVARRSAVPRAHIVEWGRGGGRGGGGADSRLRLGRAWCLARQPAATRRLVARPSVGDPLAVFVELCELSEARLACVSSRPLSRVY
eukprot:scaffold30790_cov63-Phaeocystis_antarctica.AAC.3